VIVIDAGDPGLIEAGMDTGRLPALAALRERSRHGRLAGLPGIGANAMLPSLYTGLPPQRHGRYYHQQADRGDYAAARGGETALREPAFWDTLHGVGQRLLLLNVPKGPVPTDNERMRAIANWNTHLTVPDREFATVPATLTGTLTGRHGAPLPCPCLAGRHQDSTGLPVAATVAAIEDQLARNGRLAADELAADSWDTAVVGLSAAHCAGHLFWHCHDPAHPAHPQDLPADPLQTVYAAIDRVIDQLLGAVPTDSAVALFAGPGMGPNYIHPELLGQLLDARSAGPGGAGAPGALRRHLLQHWRRLPSRWRRALSALGERADARLQRRAYRRCDCFPVRLNDNVCGVRINLAGREREGRVAPADYETLGRELCTFLADLRNDASGEPLARRVIFTADTYGAGATDVLPDVLIEWNESRPLGTVSGPGIAPQRQPRAPQWSGAHNDQLLLMAAAPGLAPGALPPDARLLDAAATFSDLAGGPAAIGEGYSLIAGARVSGAGQRARQDKDTGS
jgi:predicted AlkP superfamily phosphohydrolase/phosphomutase